MAENSSISIANSAIVCAEAIIKGEVTIGEGCVIHPFVTIDASNGPIIIGENNIFEEYVVIQNNNEGQPMIIGDSNIFQVQSECRAKYVGSRNVIGVRSHLQDGCFVSDECHIAVGCTIFAKQTIEPSVSVYGTANEHRKMASPNMPLTIQLEHLRKLLPSYHHLYGKKARAAN